MHAKAVIADRSVAFVTSANLTGSAMDHNLEVGVLMRGGTARQAAPALRPTRGRRDAQARLTADGYQSGIAASTAVRSAAW